MIKNNTYMAGYIKSVIGVLLAGALIVVLGLCPTSAFAEVKKSDLIVGNTVESQGLNSSDCPSIEAKYAYVIDESGTVYFERASFDEAKIASITKIMTALVAVKYADLQNTTVTVSNKAASVGESSAMLRSGDSMNLETALKCLMIVSGNDAAQAIAESVGDEVGAKLKDQGIGNVPDNSYDAFVFAMNHIAQELGMEHTVFTNPHGLDDGTNAGDLHSCAHDVALMCKEAMSFDAFKGIVATDKTKVTITRNDQSASLTLDSTNALLTSYQGTCGIKTGFTNKAGYCFAGACERNNTDLYAIVLHTNSESQRFTDTKTLFDWVYDNTIAYPLAHSPLTSTFTNPDGTENTVPVVAEVSHEGWTDKTFHATLADPHQSVEVFRLKGNVSQEAHFFDVAGDVHAGDKVGTITFMQDNQELVTVNLLAAQDCPAPNFFEGIPIFWDKLFKGIAGEKTQADSLLINETPLIFGEDATFTS